MIEKLKNLERFDGAGNMITNTNFDSNTREGKIINKINEIVDAINELINCVSQLGVEFTDEKKDNK